MFNIYHHASEYQGNEQALGFYIILLINNKLENV